MELPLAPFFLKKFRGAYCDINDLPTLDPELARCAAGGGGGWRRRWRVVGAGPRWSRLLRLASASGWACRPLYARASPAHPPTCRQPTSHPPRHRSNLAFLKRYDGDVADLGLSFTATDSVLGRAVEVELAPRGRDTPVTADNRLAYIHRVADHRLNRQIRAPAAAFLRQATEPLLC